MYLESSGANSLARYIGQPPHFVPQFVDDSTLYKKMLWLEWVLEHAVSLLKERVISATGSGMLQNQLNHRLVGTRKFVNEYVKQHPECKENLENFRDSYELIYDENAKAKYKENAPENFVAMKVSFDAAVTASKWVMPGSTSKISVSTIEIEDVSQTFNVDLKQNTPTIDFLEKLSVDDASEKTIELSQNEEDVFFDVKEDDEEVEMPKVSPIDLSSKEVLKNRLEEISTVPSVPQIQQEKQETKVAALSEKSSLESSKEKNKNQELQNFQQVKDEMLTFINSWVLNAPNRANITFKYDKANDISRGIELITDIKANVHTKSDLESKLANFIKEGETKRDKGTASFSPIAVSYSLSHTLAEKYCPPALNEENLKAFGKFTRTVTGLSEEKIKDNLTFVNKHEKAKEKEKEIGVNLQSVGMWQKTTAPANNPLKHAEIEQTPKPGSKKS